MIHFLIIVLLLTSINTFFHSPLPNYDNKLQLKTFVALFTEPCGRERSATVAYLCKDDNSYDLFYTKNVDMETLVQFQVFHKKNSNSKN